MWHYEVELGTKVTHDLPPASGGIPRPQQPPVGWSIYDAVGATASPADEGEGSLGVEDPSWADLGVGDTVAGDADVAPWMVTGAAAVTKLLAERARRSLRDVVAQSDVHTTLWPYQLVPHCHGSTLASTHLTNNHTLSCVVHGIRSTYLDVHWKRFITAL